MKNASRHCSGSPGCSTTYGCVGVVSSLSVSVSVISLLKNGMLLRKGARDRNETVWEYLKQVAAAGMGAVPYLAGIRNESLEEVSYKGFDLLPLELQQVADACVESDGIRFVSRAGSVCAAEGG